MSFSPRPADARYEHKQLSYTSGSKLIRKLEPAFHFARQNARGFDVLHFHGDDYLAAGGKKRVRTFYGSALSEALHAKKGARRLYQGLFYVFEWVSCLRRGRKAGISQATKRALPLLDTVIPCGVELDRFTPGAGKTENPSILFIGDLHSRKRGKYIVTIFNNDILKRHPDCTLTVVGPEPCSGTNVRYAGALSENALIAEYRKAWVYCMASSYEGFGVPLIEAMACGTAVAAADTSGAREIVTHNENGLLLKDRDLAAGIHSILSDGALRARFEANGRRSVENRFDIHRIAGLYEKLYNDQ